MPRHRSPRNAFTLAELLVVMSVIVILLTVSAPALRGLLSGDSRRAAVVQVLGLVERARSTALARNASIYVGFPVQGFPVFNVTPPVAYSRYIVFRDAVEGDPGYTNGRKYVSISGWERLPSGMVFGNFESTVLTGGSSVVITYASDLFPPIPEVVTGAQPSQYSLRILKINSAGAVEVPSVGEVTVSVADGFYLTSNGNFVSTRKASTGSKLYIDQIRIARYTGQPQADLVAKP